MFLLHSACFSHFLIEIHDRFVVYPLGITRLCCKIPRNHSLNVSSDLEKSGSRLRRIRMFSTPLRHASVGDSVVGQGVSPLPPFPHLGMVSTLSLAQTVTEFLLHCSRLLQGSSSIGTNCYSVPPPLAQTVASTVLRVDVCQAGY